MHLWTYPYSRVYSLYLCIYVYPKRLRDAPNGSHGLDIASDVNISLTRSVRHEQRHDVPPWTLQVVVPKQSSRRDVTVPLQVEGRFPGGPCGGLDVYLECQLLCMKIGSDKL